MDQALLRTFLEVARTRHFGKAAASLCITQSAVSARIKQLESALGVDLFTRRRNDIQLTPAGQRLHWHAELLIRSWERARLEVAQGGRSDRTLALGCTPDLWTLVACDWVSSLDPGGRALGLRIEIQSPADLAQQLKTGLLDLAFGFESACDADLELEPAGAIELELVASRPDLSPAQAVAQGYIQVEWGSAFMLAHASAFPDAPTPAIHVSHGLVARDLLQRCGGAAYLPSALTRSMVGSGQLFYVEGAPVYHRPLYMTYRPAGALAALIREIPIGHDQERL